MHTGKKLLLLWLGMENQKLKEHILLQICEDMIRLVFQIFHVYKYMITDPIFLHGLRVI